MLRNKPAEELKAAVKAEADESEGTGGGSEHNEGSRQGSSSPR